MNKIILIAVLLVNFVSNAQIHNASGNIKSKSSFVFTNDDYIGYWYSAEYTHIVIWKDRNNTMQMVEFSSATGVPFEIISTDFNKTNLYVKTNYKENNWISESEYTFVDSTTLKCTVSGNDPISITYKKIR